MDAVSQRRAEGQALGEQQVGQVDGGERVGH